MAVRLILAFMDERTNTAKKSPAGRRGGTRMTGGWGCIRPRSLSVSAWRRRAGPVKAGFTRRGAYQTDRLPAAVGKRRRLPLWCEIDAPAGIAMTAAIAALPRYRRGDEFASSLLHGLGIVLSIGGLAVLVTFAALRGDARAVTASAVYGVTLILLYTASTLYHAIPNVTAKPLLRTLDHIAIYLLIAGTYTPFTLLALPGVWGWSLFAAVWTLALVGSVLELGWFRRWRKLAVLLYVGMGWIGMLAFKPLAAHLQAGGMALLIGGGVAYTLGVPFYLWRKLPYQHTLWHAFVLAGSVLHYFAVLLYVLPVAA